MLYDASHNRLTQSPFPTNTENLLERLGCDSTSHFATSDDAVAAIPRQSPTGQRSFSTSALMDLLSRNPNSPLLDQLRRLVREDLGDEEAEVNIEHQVELMFGLLVWECIIRAPGQWTFTDNFDIETDCYYCPMDKVYSEWKSDQSDDQ